MSILTPGRKRRKAAARHEWVQQWRKNVLAEIEMGGQPVGALEPLRQMLIGLTRREAAAALGEPKTSFSAGPAKVAGHWNADTWYYPMDLKNRIAIAVHFEGEKVSGVEELIGPASA
jgi:hypothetical protein